MPHQAATGFRETATPEGSRLELRPVPLPGAYLAAALLLAGLFGMPALAVLLVPARQDPLSLAAAAGGLGIAAWAGLALRGAWRARRPQRLDLSPAGIALGAAPPLPWPEIGAVEAVAGSAGTAAAPGGAAALGARIATARLAHEWRVRAVLADGTVRFLAQGLDAAAATRLQALLERERQRRTASAGG